MVTTDAETGKELERRDLVKGYEFRKNQYLLLSDEDFDSVKVESSAVMTVEKFVETDTIDPVYYDSAYFLAPDREPDGTFTPSSARPSPRPARPRCRAWSSPSGSARSPFDPWATALWLIRSTRTGTSTAPRNCSTTSAAIKIDPEMVQLATQLVQRQAGRLRVRRSGGPIRNPPARDDRRQAQGRRDRRRPKHHR